MLRILLNILLIIIFTNSYVYSQWQNKIGYSISSQTFNNIEEWRLFNDEIQIHIDETSYFYNERNFKLLDEVVVKEDSFIPPSHPEYSKSTSTRDILDSKFDKYIINTVGQKFYILNEKNSDTICVIDFQNYFKVVYSNDYGDLYLSDTYKILSFNEKIIIYNNPGVAIWEYKGSRHSYGFTSFPLYIVYDLKKDTLITRESLKTYYESIKLYSIDNINNIDLAFVMRYPNNESKGFKVFYPLLDSTRVISLESEDKKTNSFLNYGYDYIINYNNDKFTITDLLNWDNVEIDSTLFGSNSRLIHEVKSKIFLMKSEGLGYFLYNINSKSIQSLKKLNDIDKLLELRDEKINLENNNFYALSNENKIVRISLTSDLKNLISPNFSVDKTLADSNYVFKFENKSEGDIDSVIWDFGDGSISRELNPTHKYQNSGKYSVSLKCYSNGNEISYSKNELIYIPTPVRLNVKYTMTMNENDATISVTNGATGSNLKHTLVYTNYPYFFDVPYPLIDTISASGYSFRTRYSFMLTTFKFDVSNELYRATDIIKTETPEFDFWSNNIKKETIIGKINNYYSQIDYITKSILIEKPNDYPFIVNETINKDILIENINSFEDTLSLENKSIKYNTRNSFLTNDNILYFFKKVSNNFHLDSINLKNQFNLNDNFTILKTNNDDEYVLIDKNNTLIISSYGEIKNILKSIGVTPQIFFSDKNYYVVGYMYKLGAYKDNRINIYNKDMELITFFDYQNENFLEKSKISFISSKEESLKLLGESGVDISLISLNLKTNSTSTETIQSGQNLILKYSNVINQKLFRIYNYNADKFYYYGENYFSKILLLDDNLDTLYNYSLDERKGRLYSYLVEEDKVYLFGKFYKDDGNFYNTFIELDINDKLTLSVNEKVDHNILEIYPNPSKDAINIEYNQPITKIQIFDQLGKIYFQSNFYDNKIDISNLKPGVYFIKINNKETSKFIKE